MDLIGEERRKDDEQRLGQSCWANSVGSRRALQKTVRSKEAHEGQFSNYMSVLYRFTTVPTYCSLNINLIIILSKIGAKSS